MKDYDIIIMGISSGDPEKDSWIKESEARGMTWYVEVVMGDDLDKYLEKISKGPPWKDPTVNTSIVRFT